MNIKQKSNAGDLVRIKYIGHDNLCHHEFEGIIVETGIFTYPTIRNYLKIDNGEAFTYTLEEQYIESLEIIKTRQQLIDEKDNKPKYPLVIKHFTYSISICGNLAQVLIYKATRQNEMHIIDLSKFTKEEILNLYNTDRDFLADLIIKKVSIDNYDTKIDKLLHKANELEEEQDNLYDDIDNMIKEFKELDK